MTFMSMTFKNVLYSHILLRDRQKQFTVITKGPNTASLCIGWRQPIGCLIFTGHFPQKSPVIHGSFAARDLQPRYPMHFCNPLEPFVIIIQRTEWRRPIGCLKSQVICCKRASNHRALLHKMTSKDKASCDSTPLCIIRHPHIYILPQLRYTVNNVYMCV